MTTTVVMVSDFTLTFLHTEMAFIQMSSVLLLQSMDNGYNY
jgi:hypothetical protein